MLDAKKLRLVEQIRQALERKRSEHFMETTQDANLEITPTFELTTPIDGFMIDSVAAERTISKAKLEGDIRKLEKDAAEAIERAKTLRAALRIYYPDSVLLTEADEEVASQEDRFDSLSIAEASDLIFRELGNPWLSLAALDNELIGRGKQCSKGSIDIMLKGSPDKFEVEKRGKRNVFRLRSKVYDINSRTTK
ncbi:MAG: hypothetical protein ABI833_11420 [Acidobacteriota bacterium]